MMAGRDQSFHNLALPVNLMLPTYQLVGLLPISQQHTGTELKKYQSIDLRYQWFINYSLCKFGTQPSLVPNIFSTLDHPLASLTSEPLLLYLLCRFGVEQASYAHIFSDHGEFILDLDEVFSDYDGKGFTRNDIYASLINSIRFPIHRDMNEFDRPYHEGGLPEEEFEVTIACLAAAAWRNGSGRRATVAEFLEEADRINLRDQALRFVTASRGKDPEYVSNPTDLSLVSAFYFKAYEEEDFKQEEFEFTHKSFSSYLVAKAIVNASLGLAQANLARDDEVWETQKRSWCGLIGNGIATEEIMKFIDGEILIYNRDIVEKRTLDTQEQKTAISVSSADVADVLQRIFSERSSTINSKPQSSRSLFSGEALR